VAASFLPTAIKFHYLFNLRDLTNVFEGIKFATSDVVKTPLVMVRLYVHEATRVYSDKMTTGEDYEKFKEVSADECSPLVVVVPAL
jgi:dynein heavy chain